jgi:hypothetical protein
VVEIRGVTSAGSFLQQIIRPGGSENSMNGSHTVDEDRNALTTFRKTIAAYPCVAKNACRPCLHFRVNPRDKRCNYRYVQKPPRPSARQEIDSLKVYSDLRNLYLVHLVAIEFACFRLLGSRQLDKSFTTGDVVWFKRGKLGNAGERPNQILHVSSCAIHKLHK